MSPLPQLPGALWAGQADPPPGIASSRWEHIVTGFALVLFLGLTLAVGVPLAQLARQVQW